MIALERLPEPGILTRNGEKWLQPFLERSSQQPDSRQYGNWEIRNALRVMSFHKCFYCERKLTEENRPFTQAEKEAIMSFGQADHEFSLMFWSYLALTVAGME